MSGSKVRPLSLFFLLNFNSEIFLGDESFRTDDSNLFGPVPAALIQSKLVRILWPPDRFGPLAPLRIPEPRNGPAYRHAMDEVAREKARRARVKAGRPYGVDANTY